MITGQRKVAKRLPHEATQRKQYMYLGIDNQTGLIYEGTGNPDIPAIPLPTVTQAMFIEKPQDWARLPAGLSGDAMRWMFREDSFDAVTRTRRGRVYQPWSTQPSEHPVAPHPYDDPTRRVAAAGRRLTKYLNVYVACSELLNKPRKGEGGVLALGSTLGASAWRIIQTEVLANGAVMVTLKAKSAYGILPELDMSALDPEFRTSVDQAINRVLDSAFRETPISVIDHCRNAINTLITCWLIQQGHAKTIISADLGRSASAIAATPYNKNCVSNLAQVVARLHVRGKGNEQLAKSLRIPVEEDAELALQALSFAVRDLGFALS